MIPASTYCPRVKTEEAFFGTNAFALALWCLDLCAWLPVSFVVHVETILKSDFALALFFTMPLLKSYPQEKTVLQ
jgi:hypothetical protein